MATCPLCELCKGAGDVLAAAQSVGVLESFLRGGLPSWGSRRKRALADVLVAVVDESLQRIDALNSALVVLLAALWPGLSALDAMDQHSATCEQYQRGTGEQRLTAQLRGQILRGPADTGL